MQEKLRALSLRQPWAWLVINGYEDIEKRSWRTNHRGRLLIHASSSSAWINSEFVETIRRDYGVALPAKFDLGGIVGVVEVTDCVKRHPLKWKFQDSWGWVLENPRQLAFRPCKGFVGLFKPKL